MKIIGKLFVTGEISVNLDVPVSVGLPPPLDISKRTVAYNPLHPIKVEGLSVTDPTPTLKTALPPVICQVCQVERQSGRDPAYR